MLVWVLLPIDYPLFLYSLLPLLNVNCLFQNLLLGMAQLLESRLFSPRWNLCRVICVCWSNDSHVLSRRCPCPCTRNYSYLLYRGLLDLAWLCKLVYQCQLLLICYFCEINRAGLRSLLILNLMLLRIDSFPKWSISLASLKGFFVDPHFIALLYSGLSGLGFINYYFGLSYFYQFK